MPRSFVDVWDDYRRGWDQLYGQPAPAPSGAVVSQFQQPNYSAQMPAAQAYNAAAQQPAAAAQTPLRLDPSMGQPVGAGSATYRDYPRVYEEALTPATRQPNLQTEPPWYYRFAQPLPARAYPAIQSSPAATIDPRTGQPVGNRLAPWQMQWPWYESEPIRRDPAMGQPLGADVSGPVYADTLAAFANQPNYAASPAAATAAQPPAAAWNANAMAPAAAWNANAAAPASGIFGPAFDWLRAFGRPEAYAYPSAYPARVAANPEVGQPLGAGSAPPGYYRYQSDPNALSAADEAALAASGGTTPSERAAMQSSPNAGLTNVGGYTGSWGAGLAPLTSALSSVLGGSRGGAGGGGGGGVYGGAGGTSLGGQESAAAMTGGAGGGGMMGWMNQPFGGSGMTQGTAAGAVTSALSSYADLVAKANAPVSVNPAGWAGPIPSPITFTPPTLARNTGGAWY